jgi:hypothetical protein
MGDNNNDSVWEKVGMGIVVLIVVLLIAIIGLFGWGFIELIQWITSK